MFAFRETSAGLCLVVFAAGLLASGCLLNRDGSGEQQSGGGVGGTSAGGTTQAGGASGFPGYDAGPGGIDGSAAGAGGMGGGDAGGSGGADSGADAGGSGGAGTCGVDEQCESVPAGWTWGYVADDKTEDVACAGKFTKSSSVFHGKGIDAANAACGCQCQDIEGSKACGPPVLYNYGTGEECSQQTNGKKIDAACTGYTIPANTIWGNANYASGTCTATAQSSVPTATWRRNLALCSATGGSGCGADMGCVPSLPSGAVACVWKANAANCPSSYGTKYVFYTDWKDDRGCTPCTCEVSPKQVCPVEISLWGEQTCSAGSSVTATMDMAGCGMLSLSYGTKAYVKLTAKPLATYACGVSKPSAPQGGVVPDEKTAMTVCCSGKLPKP